MGICLDGIQVYEKMLELNPDDNQGVRDPLLALYLQTGDLKGAGRLLKKYEDNASANFAWGRVLERFLTAGEGGAIAALKAAWVNHEEACSWVFDQWIAEEQRGVVSKDALLRASVSGKKVQ